jgi:hypothetical protein
MLKKQTKKAGHESRSRAQHINEDRHFDVGADPLAYEEDPPPLGLTPDPLGAPQPNGSAGGKCMVQTAHTTHRATGRTRATNGATTLSCRLLLPTVQRSLALPGQPS